MFPRVESDPTLTSVKWQKTLVKVCEKSHMVRKRLVLPNTMDLFTSRSTDFKIFSVAGIRSKWPELGQGPNSGHFRKLIKKGLRTADFRLFPAETGS